VAFILAIYKFLVPVR